jgi:hypothetical protein
LECRIVYNQILRNAKLEIVEREAKKNRADCVKTIGGEGPYWTAVPSKKKTKYIQIQLYLLDSYGICIYSCNHIIINIRFFQFSAFILYEGGILGITAGAHRLWSHRAYKATWQLRLVLMLLHTLAFQVGMSSCLLRL